MRAQVWALVVAGACATALLALASRQNPSVILRLVMSGWVLAPLIALACIPLVFTAASRSVRTAWRRACWVVATTYIVVFGIDAVRALSTKRALPFVLIPLLAWLAVAVVGGVAWLRRARPQP